jgi:catechol 2,3-dioxygenase-like lactoylglutathione lyase family enzyme
MNLNQVTAPSTDVARSIEFYRRLGLRLIVDALPDYARFDCPGGAMAVAGGAAQGPRWEFALPISSRKEPQEHAMACGGVTKTRSAPSGCYFAFRSFCNCPAILTARRFKESD